MTFPTFRAGDLILLEIEVTDASGANQPNEPRMDPTGSVLVTIWRGASKVLTSVDRAIMTRVETGIYRYEWSSDAIVDVYLAEFTANHGGGSQVSQLYAPFRLIV